MRKMRVSRKIAMDESIELIHILQSEIDKVRTRVHTLVNEVANQNLVIVKLTDKLDNRPPCDLHVSSMKELNDSVTRIEIINASTAGKVDGFISSVNRLLEKIEADVYKSGGLISTSQNNKNQIGLMWGIIAAIFIAGSVMFVWKH